MARELAPKLREQGADIIVALTHMVQILATVLIQREPNDVLLAKSVPEGFIDIILGGHDHYVSPFPNTSDVSTTSKSSMAFPFSAPVQISNNYLTSKPEEPLQTDGIS